jgi:alpha 1,2-mannosyltransferase
MLARNSDVQGAVDSIRHLEDRWNHVYHYPWVLLNDEEFTEKFKVYVVTTIPFDNSYMLAGV